MNERIETRLREHLVSIDDVRVHDSDAVRAAVGRASRRLQHRRRSLAATASMVLIGGATVAVLSNRGSITGSIESTVPQAAPQTVPVSVTTTVGGSGGVTTDSWPAISPDPRGATLAPWVVWTGKEALVVGGLDPKREFRGGAVAYDIATDSWRRLADPPSGARRVDPVAVWTGALMLVIGGFDNPDGSSLPVSSGESYDPVDNTWRVIAAPPAGFVSDRSPAVWNGTELLVWPVDGEDSTIAPIAYNPAIDSWRTLAKPPMAGRRSAASVWTGTRWIVWGGTTGTSELGDGAAYDPTSDTWTVLARSPLSPRRVRAAWTGSEMIVDAGATGGDLTGNFEMALGDGAAYDPATDTWRTIASGPAHPAFVPVWTGEEMVMFAKGGASVYHVASNRWTDSCCDPGDGSGTAVWTGSVTLVVGSDNGNVGGSVFAVPAG